MKGHFERSGTPSCRWPNCARAHPDHPLSALPAPGRRPPELDNPAWLRARYERDGDNVIATELGVSRKAVRVARQRHGIESRGPGRPRGAVSSRRAAVEYRSAAFEIVARIGRQSRAGGPAPTYDLLLGRLAEIDRARRAGDTAAEEDGLIELGAACGLVLEHLRRLRAA